MDVNCVVDSQYSRWTDVAPLRLNSCSLRCRRGGKETADAENEQNTPRSHAVSDDHFPKSKGTGREGAAQE